MHPYFRVDDVSKTKVIMDHACKSQLHVSMPAGAPRDGSLIPTRRTTPWLKFTGEDIIGGTSKKPTYFDDEFKAYPKPDRLNESACSLMKTEIRDGKGSSVLWQDASYRFTQIFTGSMEL